MKAVRTLLAAWFALAGLAPAHADVARRAVSGLTTRPLVELYTSEGCDSCPPADAWLRERFPAADTDVAVLAFHVDYWDQLGWRDRFAASAFSARQRAEVGASGARVVYTPQVLVQGKDAGLFRSASVAQALDAARRLAPGADIELDVQQSGDGVHVTARARLHDGVRARTARVHVALTDSALRSAVQAGENRGRELAHDHVVRAFGTSQAPGADGHTVLTLDVRLPQERGRDPQVIAFVQDSATGAVLQSIVLPLCGA